MALLSYTQSVLYSPADSNPNCVDLALAYGNRSAVLFRLHKYQECIKDIERAIECGYPAAKRHKLAVRRLTCFVRLGQREAAEQELDALKAEMQSSCDQEKSNFLCQEAERANEEIMSMDKKQGKINAEEPREQRESPHVSHSTNSVLVQATSAVEMVTSPSQGRFLKAKQDISAGDTLIVERPYAAVLLPSHYSSHCHLCFGVLPPNPVACRQCSTVLFCDESCRSASWKRHHSVECRYMDLLHSVGIAHLALRIVLTAGLPYLIDFLSKRQEVEADNGRSVPGLTKEGRYERNYLSVYDLMTHSSDMIPEDLLQYSMTASVLLAVLLHSGWLHSNSPGNQGDGNMTATSKANQGNQRTANNNSTGEGENVFAGEPNDGDLPSSLCHKEKEILDFLNGNSFCSDGPEEGVMERVWKVGGLLLRHVQQLVCNAHAITAIQATQEGEGGSVQDQREVRVATAIYPTASLMNHACSPTILSSFQKDVLIVKAVKDVPCGGEMFNCYGPHVRRMDRQNRVAQLKAQYFFDCSCPDCSAVASPDDNDSSLSGLKCEKCSRPYSVYGVKQKHMSCCDSVDLPAILSRLQSAEAHFDKGANLLSKGNHAKALACFRKCLEVRSRLMSNSNLDLGQVHDAMAQCLANAGDYASACDHLRSSAAVTEAVFGVQSIEAARELHKMAEVQVHAGRPKEALTSASRALKAARTLHPASHPWVEELQCFVSALTSIIAQS